MFKTLPRKSQQAHVTHKNQSSAFCSLKYWYFSLLLSSTFAEKYSFQYSWYKNQSLDVLDLHKLIYAERLGGLSTMYCLKASKLAVLQPISCMSLSAKIAAAVVSTTRPMH